ncbi:Gfo/Idh/MocA family oxidoreductase [Gilvimarinus sp. SDUM040013]|uniref:Gfo/Idh/MocA family oxidoreductase n=1 Tax=Gilvimarinus gilvus TaxID=3058038 RepID=A0ABU4S3R5_9GAMM|nr:Gfo/Idh/MocA family oxidoreductase [Gilvimarinus sp. SDUM040013]MDO3385620.1 Gfo/Idh/MocA family oxidoreductase [Gilvimarinus sp. SDUM040013]MDX6849954.1 Gfo/Idh/MocA family oxidoreductase [Gilvimarinus sp. SDUM040013]
MKKHIDVKDGANYAPTAESEKVVAEGEFQFAVAHLDHGHIYGQTNGLIDAGGTLKYVYDTDPARVEQFVQRYPQVQVASDFQELLDDPDIKLVAAAAIPNQRASIGIEVMRAGKDYFTDKSPFTTLQQLEQVEKVVAQTGQKYMVYYSERLHNDAAWRAGELIAEGAIGRVIQVLNLAPHRLAKSTRPAWFFDKQQYGGILTDIGSHQVEQFLTYANCKSATVNYARASNLNNPDRPGLEDFGEISLTGDNGSSFYTRVDWFTPEGQTSWGDGRTFIVGTEGSLELRKYLDVGRQTPSSKLLLVNAEREQEIECLDQTGFPFFGQLILDVMNRTEHAMTQAHAFKAAELSLQAQLLADATTQN